ncbi:hypothetical protein AA101099_0065 [Neoasaia chiangmaiensis NBRC 101099]|uniref:Uncharacterized protein n=1 Tax=Neoasaia chiangmaiensis TaxID=320497 RepID=A0A1U9KLU2_9PROT|nr:hypothetical protein [Neoasaia chiangmaiensis]AQS86762.1 hypothetical protein A0U93_00985 [Neoasaia chiangmaiensis]GBR35537.1 hypothetical protein AA101099_0065 [Neoasaia chiangmaiensis NBRC 101099]GEN16384.1 hypothetical protein NCH01_28150 [Neoasaia chiangmaiensis]
MRLFAYFLPVAATVICLVGCTPPDFNHPGPLANDAAYDGLFPQWAELCAVSQISKKPGYGADIAGGPGGHAVMFLHGACLDPHSTYPVLHACADGGTGISMNAHFVNANWVGIGDRAFFFDGILRPGEGLGRADYQATKAEAQKRGLYSAINFRDWAVADRPAGTSRESWKYEVSIGTDYAVSFGRARYCARLPLTEKQMSRAISFLNSRNAPYHQGEKTFDTNVLQDNCNHLTHNALAAAGFWHNWPVDRFILTSAFSFPVPKNEVVNLLDRAARHAPDDLHALYHDPLTRRSLMDDGWLPGEPGIILDSHPVRTPNDVYNTRLALIFYDDPVLGHYHRAFQRYLDAPRYHDLRANLLWYRALYARISAERKPLAWWLGREPSDFSAFYNAYYDWLTREQALVERGLNQLPAPGASAWSVIPVETPPAATAQSSALRSLPPAGK